ncbi:purine-nucleoside phosphorylase [Olegusella massiliensis]|uniref:purine-nucleoside phosphorylase n=1 Tax=Olegusella massiliensis TaxID=1776381 RepID=UPI0008386912|nr:purine-nucleoside phosphorylase [Olegusella massiliensis]
MPNVPTPHNAALEGQIAKTVLMPGDPLRAQYVAEHYLENVTCFNTVRNMLGFTGTYQGQPVSVMGGGMGMPSVGIYTYELFNFYEVDQIIRIGSAGGLAEGVQLRDLVIGMGACTDSNYAAQFNMPGTYAPLADYDLLRRAVNKAEELGVPTRVGNILSTDVFYNADPTVNERWASMGVLAVEMEAVALYLNAAYAKKRALCLLTVSDLPLSGEALSAKERQTSFTQMMEVALALAIPEN